MIVTTAPISRFPAALRLFTPVLVAVGLASCNSVNKPDSGYTEYSGKPANYPADGRYNPYPQGVTKPAQPSSQYQEYTQDTGRSSGAYQQQPTSKPKTTASSTTAKKKPTSTASTTKKPEAKSAKASTTHIVKKGDTLYGLAKKYKTTIEAIKQANNKTTDILRDGEKLKIP